MVIDDPVQSMDPSRVDGLAHALHDAARTRQVVVFTHDDRLPQAVRHLLIPATVIEVMRRPNSVVETRRGPQPDQGYFEDAHAIRRTEQSARGGQASRHPRLLPQRRGGGLHGRGAPPTAEAGATRTRPWKICWRTQKTLTQA